MPRISYFLGISVYMFYSDHMPPHFHAVYNEYGAAVEIETGRTITGQLPPRAWRLVREWAAQHRAELLADWELSRRKDPLQPVAPLE